MKLWFRLTIVCGALLGLLLGLTPPADWNYQSHVVRSGPCFDQGKETASDSSTASLVASMECDPARAASLESLVLDRALTVSNTGPPGQETHGPAELMVALGELPLKPATQTNAIQQPSPQIYWLSTAELKIGVPQQALASRWSCNRCLHAISSGLIAYLFTIIHHRLPSENCNRHFLLSLRH